ncbi:MAG: YkgJ family cysteine cluster protein [Myxococcota bacterium]
MSRLPIVDERAKPLPTVAALERLWDEVAARPLWAGGRFFLYLRLRARMRLAMVRPEQLTSIVPEGKVNDCSACTELCCIGHEQTVSLRFRDIATLVDIGREDLMTTTKPVFSATTLAEKPALARTVASEAWRRFPVLVQNSFGACKALSDEGKCTLYPHWPTSCARFPYALDIESDEITYSPRCRSFWIRPDAGAKVTAMKVAAVAAYNERIKDLVLLAYAPERLDDLGLTRYLAQP